HDLESMVQFNFLVDVGYLLSNMYDPSIPVTIVHGQKNNLNVYSNVQLYTPDIPDRYGVHHTKAMLLFFCEKMTGIKTVQLIIMTANMIEQDWEDMTQGVYRTPRCPLKPTATTNESPFEQDLIKYLRAYKLRSVYEAIAKLRKYDFSSCKGILIGSVPGYHRQSASMFRDWGIERLATVLRQHVPSSPFHSELILQCSSLASSPQKWFLELCESMSQTKTNTGAAPKIKVVYPTMDTASKSFTGREGSGDFLRFERGSYEKNHVWFDKYLCDWQSNDAGRQRLMPHIKTYTRIERGTDGTAVIAWHLLTSANLSRAAWGEYQKNKTQIYVKSFELGVLFCPSLWKNEVVLKPAKKMKQHVHNNDNIIEVRLPYDFPLVPHPRPMSCFTRLPS
ncbi:hypothetical protein INT47_005401, partial [Mucor saturninus]